MPGHISTQASGTETGSITVSSGALLRGPTADRGRAHRRESTGNATSGWKLLTTLHMAAMVADREGHRMCGRSRISEPERESGPDCAVVALVWPSSLATGDPNRGSSPTMPWQ